MDAQTRARYEARAKIVKALAHPTRLFIVDQVAREGEKCVCELTALVGADMSTVSKHLALLKEAGILRDEKRGAMVFYQLCAPCIPDFLECVESVLLGKASAQQKVLLIPESSVSSARSEEAQEVDLAFGRN